MRLNILDGKSNRFSVVNRTSRAELGELLAISSGITQGQLGAHEAIAKAAKAMAEVLSSRGPLNLQGRWNGSAFIPFEDVTAKSKKQRFSLEFMY